MADRDDLSEIDGFASVLAVRRANKKAGRAQEKGPSQAEPPLQAIPKLRESSFVAGGLVGKIAHSIVPEKREVVCYECDYTFPMSGRLRETICPKCRAKLASGDHLIDKEWFQPIRTIGAVELIPGAVLRGADIVARDILLAGSAERGSLRACGRLELWPGARFDTSKMKTKDLIIRPGGEFLFPQPIACRNLEVEGALDAIIFAEGLVIVRTGGLLLGEVDCPRLIVEEGGGLEAQVCAGTRSSKPQPPGAGRANYHAHIGLPGRN